MRTILAAALCLAVSPALADSAAVVTYGVDGSFDDATFGVESAITDRGLVIDFVSHVGDMLNRTAGDVGGEMIFEKADIFLFCSAVVSRRVMEADPDNIAHCPYAVFVRQGAGDGPVEIGYRRMPEGPMQEVEALLDEIAREAAGN
ncbi:MAG: DUF302 domain-containing protein [Pseudomonadota bacterium]